MRTFKNILLPSLLITTVLFASAQEYDDMYFTKKDRKKVLPISTPESSPRIVYVEEPKELGQVEQVEENVQETPGENSGKSFLTRQMEENMKLTEGYENNGVSQEAIDKYKKSEEEMVAQQPADQNPNYSIPEETYQEPVVINNYYNDGFAGGWGRWGNPWWRPGFSVGLGWGWGGWYDPFWGPGFGWGVGFGWGGGFGRWGWGGWYNPFWCPPIYGTGFGVGYAGAYGRYYYRGERVGRAVVRGPRGTRGGTVSSSGRSTNLRRVAVAGEANDGRDFSKAQSAYLERSRRSVREASNEGNRAGSRNSAVSANRSRSNSNFSRSGSERSSSVGSSSSSRSRGSGSVGSSTSTRSRSGGVRSSSPSRSRSSGSMRSSSPSRSRSSGSMRSGSRGGSSRSSGSRGRSSGRGRN